MLGRRSALRGILGFAAVGKGAVESVVKEAAARQTVGYLGAGGLPSAQPRSSINQNAIEYLVYRRADAHRDRRRQRQVAGLDPDLAALGSTSYGWRRLAQQRREREADTLMARLGRAAGYLHWEDPF